MAERACWLIEAVGSYWTGRDLEDFDSDPNEAVRFARQEDAERVRCWLVPELVRKLSRTTEHIWLSKEGA